MLARTATSLTILAALTAWSGLAAAQSPSADPAAPTLQPSPAAPPPPMAPTTPLIPPPPSSAGASAGAGASGSFSVHPSATIDPASDQKKLAAQGSERPAYDAGIGSHPSQVYSEDWWGHTRPVLEIHGYFRTRGELHHDFFLGRHDAPGVGASYLYLPPLDHSYADATGTDHGVQLCGDIAANGQPSERCDDKSQASANMRWRINPELHISDNLRVMAQIDALDNLVLGSTPESYAIKPGPTNNIAAGAWGYGPAYYNGYAPLAFNSQTQGPPTPGVNSWRNAIDVKRVWAEYLTPVGQLRFGRMPQHWGLGMMWNSGDGIDSDYQTTVDKIMFVSGIRSIDLYLGGSWDFPATGSTNGGPYDVYGGQPYNLANRSNVDQWSLFIARRTNPELQRLQLARGDFVLNGGIFASYRRQQLDVASGTFSSNSPGSANDPAVNPAIPYPADNGLERRGAQVFTPDLWVQALWRKLRVEFEVATVYGEVEQTTQNRNPLQPIKLRQWGFTGQTEFRAVEDKLRMQFGFGWASGDPWRQGFDAGPIGTQQDLSGGTAPMRTFGFHPDYRVDLIFFRKILSRVEGAYYLRPSVEYDFIRNLNGQKFGGGAAIIWSRASEFMQTPGHKRDLGVELDLSVYYQAKDGSLNDDPDKIGGFYTMLQYGVFFPLGGLSYLPGEATVLADKETATAQTVRLFLGVVY